MKHLHKLIYTVHRIAIMHEYYILIVLQLGATTNCFEFICGAQTAVPSGGTSGRTEEQPLGREKLDGRIQRTLTQARVSVVLTVQEM